MSTETQTQMGGLDGVRAPGIFESSPWQMSFGERAALEAVLTQLKPKLSIEIGTAEGGSLARIAAHSNEVHSFDLVEAQPAARELENVTFHTGDNHVLLPELLKQLEAEGRNVDFALVDGDHSSEGVKRDMEDLLDSPAVGNTTIIMHDSANEVVRAGLEAVDYASYEKAKYVDLDFFAGYVFRRPDILDELWGGLALVVVDAASSASYTRQAAYFEAGELLRIARDLKVATGEDEPEVIRSIVHAAFSGDADGASGALGGVKELRSEVDDLHAQLAGIRGSRSWRMTSPLRSLSAGLKKRNS